MNAHDRDNEVPMSTYTSSVNVVIRHPSRHVDEIATSLEWEPHGAWSVGEDRVTPAGTVLPGIRQETMCSFRFERDDDQLTAALATTLKHLVSKHLFIKDLLASGGTLAINIGLNGHVNSSLDLSPEQLQTICELSIRLSVECFPDG